ncbi:protein of unknown function [Methylotuvimicrobium alcaliphilum 20Z]|uniref:Uncharacterized protein n=1 Tax=Methylotuvimicrobium alcaliphilum (strain DSM 19304 / NCIMB 14124 / VKM B-2133 / 20Z) TaxID=1091494 RepID=G4SX98_META2|nr:protein of unknown function [Methylotuvimicrobium alcaliphilum 20Z]
MCTTLANNTSAAYIQRLSLDPECGKEVYMLSSSVVGFVGGLAFAVSQQAAPFD